MAAPIRKGTLFRRMRSVASTGVVIGTTLMRYARIRAMASPTAEVRIPSRDADTRSLAERVLTPEAQTFIARLNREVAETRAGLLEARQERWADLRSGGTLRFPEETATVRAADWRVAKAPRDLQVRKVEITGPTDRKMVINALNSGASAYMAEFEDANTPTWRNLIEGQQNLSDAIDRTIEFRNPDGKVYNLGRQTATLVVRQRGWHLEEKHFLVDGMPTIGAIFDFGLYMFRNAKLLLDRGTGAYFYLPKMESYREARLWNEIFQWTEQELQIPRGSIRATVLVEVITLAFEMDEVLYELRDYSGGLNAGRWDYMFSIIKKFAGRPELILPDRAQVAMTEFDRVLERRNSQLERQRPEVSTTEQQLLDVKIPGATITDAGLRTNVSVGIQYLASWLRGTGAAAINNLMEDAATAEISRSQVWQWIQHGVALAEGPTVTRELVKKIEQEELAKIRKTVGDDFYGSGRYEEAASLFDDVALSRDFAEFLTRPGYERLD